MGETNSWTSQKPQIVTEKDLKTSWNCGKNAKYFRCSLCGHKFKLGEYWRFVYMGGMGVCNLMICKSCDDKYPTSEEKAVEAKKQMATAKRWNR